MMFLLFTRDLSLRFTLIHPSLRPDRSPFFPSLLRRVSSSVLRPRDVLLSSGARSRSAIIRPVLPFYRCFILVFSRDSSFILLFLLRDPYPSNPTPAPPPLRSRRFLFSFYLVFLSHSLSLSLSRSHTPDKFA
jgi:hypothetical protein